MNEIDISGLYAADKEGFRKINLFFLTFGFFLPRRYLDIMKKMWYHNVDLKGWLYDKKNIRRG